MYAKYVVVNYSELKGETIFIFPEHVKHKDFIEDSYYTMPAISAGFVTLRNNDLICHGESVSLNLKARPGRDTILANNMFGGI